MKKTTFEVTSAQLDTLKRLRILLADLGYSIFDVAMRFRRNEHDFIAVPHIGPGQFVRVRPTESGKVVVQPFAASVLYVKLRKRLKGVRDNFTTPVLWNAEALPPVHAQKHWWKVYLPEADHEEALKRRWD